MAEPSAESGSNQQDQLQDQLQDHLRSAGLELLGTCHNLSDYSLKWRHEASLLEDMTPAEADALGELMLLVRAAPGQTLIREGDLGDWMFLLLSGTVDVVKTSASGEISRLAVLKLGAAVGEMSMLDAAPRYASCIAIDDVRVGVLSRAAVAQLIHAQPAVGAKLLVKLTQLLAQRLRNTSNQLVKLLQAKA